jgi:antitoxin VapB
MPRWTRGRKRRTRQLEPPLERRHVPYPRLQSGNSQTVRIPAEFAYEDTVFALSINRYGDVIVIAPVRQTLKEMVAALRAMPKPSQIETYEPIELPERGWD